MVKFLSDTKRITRLLLPWRPCLDSKLWTKSRSDINRAFGTQIISRPESCLFLNNNVNRKKGKTEKLRMEKRTRGVVLCKCEVGLDILFILVIWGQKQTSWFIIFTMSNPRYIIIAKSAWTKKKRTCLEEKLRRQHTKHVN